MPTHSRKTILLATDQKSSVLSALDANRSDDVAYAPYGHRNLGNGLLSLLGFNGELLDLMTGHYHLGKGYRQFNPVLMRFNSPDSLSPFGKGGRNAYAYCGGDPVNQTDPSGHFIVGSLISKMIKNAKSHHSGPKSITTSTLSAIQDTADKLGGEKMISQLAKKEKVKPKTFLLEETIKRQQLKTNEIFSQAPSKRSIDDMNTIITHLNESNDIYSDILVGTREGKFRPKNIKEIHRTNETTLGALNWDLHQKQKTMRQNQ
ncbi:RHS repeat-associated core domain-containing protein [Pseudomonas sp. PCH199]|uniref:RHS repeat-associated core domain-containing protein n=1 Tax=unclassified Pseudomonas TaxID=196821 RepID=UPI000BC8EE5D|nr:RHS repeat-associated core domain-containing protein [Pseudomonas sp. PCH199]PAM85457.1 hypothetical protein CES87_03015 [Pseudomonas sp. ERMR1:02]